MWRACKKAAVAFLFSSHCCYAVNPNYSKAENAALRAFYAQSGISSYVNDTISDLDRRYLPKYIKENGAIPLIISEALIRRRIEWKWTFP